MSCGIDFEMETDVLGNAPIPLCDPQHHQLVERDHAVCLLTIATALKGLLKEWARTVKATFNWQAKL